MARFRVAATLLLFAALAACHDKPAPTTPTGPVTATGLQIFGAPTASMGVGQTVHLRAVETYSDGTSTSVTAGIVWASSSPATATIGADGTVVAMAEGSTTITVSLAGLNRQAIVRVVQNWIDLDFRVAILNGSSSNPAPSDVTRVFARANDLLFERTGSRMRLMDMRTVGPGTGTDLAAAYMDTLSGEQPDGIVVWSDDPAAVSAGGFSQTLARPAPYVNRFPGVSGSGRVYVSSIDYDHKYARCGYDATGDVRVSDRSAGGECRGQSGLMCVDNGRFWECPDARQDFYGDPDVYLAATIVHEFMHPVGTAGNNDHYGTSTCTARTGMSAAQASNRVLFQWHCGQCPDLFLHFRPSGAPSTAGRAR